MTREFFNTVEFCKEELQDLEDNFYENVDEKSIGRKVEELKGELEKILGRDLTLNEVQKLIGRVYIDSFIEIASLEMATRAYEEGED